MYAKYFKRTLTGLIASLMVFSVCFVFHFSALATDPTESAPSQTISSEVSSQPESSAPSSPSSEDSDLISDPSSEDSSQESDPSLDESSFMESSDAESSESVSSEEVVSQISDGGAPDFYDEQYYNDGSYEYHGSYTGLSSSVNSDDQNNDSQKTPVNRSHLAKKYAKYFMVGMVVFGGLSILLIVALIYFNLKVKRSKETYPDWYKRREAAKKGKHAKH